MKAQKTNEDFYQFKVIKPFSSYHWGALLTRNEYITIPMKDRINLQGLKQPIKK